MKIISSIQVALKKSSFLFLILVLQIFGQEPVNKIILIEWDKNPLATEYELQISDSIKFLDILYNKKTKDTVIRLEPNPKYLYGRIAGIDEFGVRGGFSEVFEIEQRTVEKKKLPLVVPIPSNYLSQNHLIFLDISEDEPKKLVTYYKINNGKWLTYNDAIRLTNEGLNIIQYYTEDRLGNREKIKTKEYILDTEAPSISAYFTNTYTDKENFTFTGKNTKIEIKVDDLSSGVNSVKVYLRTANESQEMEWTPNLLVSIPEILSDKVVELVVIASDRLGNTKAYSKFFKHDLKAPEVFAESFTKIDSRESRVSIIEIKANDSYSGIYSILYSLNNSPPQSYFEPILISEPGEYELKFQAIDNVGNKSPFQYERIFIPEPKRKKSK